jgi:RHH-type proline utilization regulon transcriptional repressor/proline dehydrogenase/delta 1-pyrroline-5-carboxylate dehydrogenase
MRDILFARRSGDSRRRQNLALRATERSSYTRKKGNGMPELFPSSDSIRSSTAPFAAFVADVRKHDGLRAAIDAAYRAAETEWVPPLLKAAALPAAAKERARGLARRLIEALRARPAAGLVQGLMHEYALSSQEGVALMCLAEALLRIPDSATRDALIADKIGGGEWRAHIGQSPSPFVNAATWGLLVTGRLVGTFDENSLGAALTRLIARSGAPIIRASVDTAMRVMGEQFVCGQTIEAALHTARKLEAQGFRYSYDMLGEAAATAEDAARYFASYTEALHAIGAASAGRGIYEGPGLSIKLSALHPRYQRAQRQRVMEELLPRLKALAMLARRYDVGVNIDAEESERLDLSLDLLEALCRDPDLADWNGVGFVVQAYQKRSFAVIAFLIDLARRTRRRIMVRLVKGAYWDSEIKRSQVEGFEDFPVFTRKIYTDVSYIACAKQLLAAPGEVYPQFATHNALTLATVYAAAGPNFYAGQYEFQCLHGMGEPLYAEVVGAAHLNRPCRIYAPVGSHETLLAYLVRRLLENGANTSFVNRIADASLSLDALLEDPVDAASALDPVGAPHPKITLPRDLFGAGRKNSAGLDLSSEARLSELSTALLASAGEDWRAGAGDADLRAIVNPANRADIVGHVAFAGPQEIADRIARAAEAWPAWRDTAPADRAERLMRAAALFEAKAGALAGVMCREAGKTLPNALGDVREAVDFLRYYAAEIGRDFSNATHKPLGVVACISPWNFPLAIFTGQISAALAAGNVVIAKPAEETPLVAAEAVRLLHEAGVPEAVVQLLPGDGEVGAALTAHPLIAGVLFTGSTEVARIIQRALARRLGADGAPIPLIAETGGQNALLVDSSALAEQVVADVLSSAFDSAGQRCSALRVLCLQEDIAERTLAMIKAAMSELRTGQPDRLATDLGPVISREALATLTKHVKAMRERGFAVHAPPLGEDCADGNFIAPTLIEIAGTGDLSREVFGPILHVLRFRREDMTGLIDAINASGYALTGGVHSRIDGVIDLVGKRLSAGNIYVNRNIIGAVVGVQPFGGHSLSGTGPKAGGPLYLKRLLSGAPDLWPDLGLATPSPIAKKFCEWLTATGRRALSDRCAAIAARARLGVSLALPGPVGEQNVYSLHRRGAILCHAGSEEAAIVQIACALSAGNDAKLAGKAAPALFGALPRALHGSVDLAGANETFAAVLTDSEGEALSSLLREIADKSGPIASVFSLSRKRFEAGESWPLDWLMNEHTLTVNTTAAGGNASLMSIG